MKKSNKLLRLASILLAVATVATLALCLTACDNTPQTEELKLNVMSFNIRVETSNDTGIKNWSKRKQPLIKYVLDKSPDVICMQETTVTQASDIKKGLQDVYTTVFYRRETNNGNSEGLTICYKTDMFELQSQQMFWLSETPEEMSKGWGADYYRICVNTLLRHKQTGVVLDVYNVHLDHQVELARTNGLKLILQRMSDKGYPTVVMGDFNTTSDSECYDVIAEKMQDCQQTANFTDDGITYHNWGTPLNKLNSKTAIDFCFVSNNVLPWEFNILDGEENMFDTNGYYSDHYAISSVLYVKYTLQND